MTNVYVQAIAVDTAAASLLYEIFRKCLKAIPQEGQFEIIDERHFPGTADPSEYVFRMTCPNALVVANEAVAHFLTTKANDVSISLFSLQEDSVAPDLTSDVEVFNYRDETKVGGHVHWTDSCVRLVHRQTGVEARSQAYRSKSLNYAEAMSLLRAKLLARSAKESHAA